MAVYNITNANLNQLRNYISNAETVLDTRRALWAGLPPEIREQWKVSCPDPVLDEAYKLYVWLKAFFEVQQ
jgi:hypothetical protein